MANASLPPQFEPWGGYVNCSSRADCIALSGGVQLVSCVAFSGGLPEGAPLNRGVCVCSLGLGRQGADCDDVVDGYILAMLTAVPPLAVNIATIGYTARNMYIGSRVPGFLLMNEGMGVIVSSTIVSVLQVVWQVIAILGFSIPARSPALVLTNSILIAGSMCATLVSVL
jgi:hypothetical protein